MIPTVLLGQTGSGGILGTVTDKAARPLPGATVTITPPVGWPISTFTDANGRYQFPGLSRSSGRTLQDSPMECVLRCSSDGCANWCWVSARRNDVHARLESAMPVPAPDPNAKCPYCDRVGMLGHEREFVGGQAVTRYKCHACNRTWQVADESSDKTK